MLRFPNPGSDIDSFVRIFVELFEALSSRESFDLDDMSRTLVERNLATSCGHMGEAALARSTRADRSRDPLYNQSKMYSELYKALGWIHPHEVALRFRFTYLGAHVFSARRYARPVIYQSLLGMAYPNLVVNVKGDHVLRPFATILRTMRAMDGMLCRDELIIGPMSLASDRQAEAVDEMIQDLRSVRGDLDMLSDRLSVLSDELGIATNTMQNYTRFPLGVLKWTGWVRQERLTIYGRSIPFLVLTDEGAAVCQEIDELFDLRYEEVQRLDQGTRGALLRLSFYEMLDRAGFDTSSVHESMVSDRLAAEQVLELKGAELLFSPFQELGEAELDDLFPRIYGRGGEGGDESALDAELAELRRLSRVSIARVPSTNGVVPYEQEHGELYLLVQERAAELDGRADVIDDIAESLQGSGKDEFYPFVAQCFEEIGYRCEVSRPGVNYQRWDAMVIDDEESIPIEIKSPAEEEHLSVKAVRQAAENKIVLVARGAYPTRVETTSLAIGYKLPNDRSEVALLVSDIEDAFGLGIGIIDIYSLITLTVSHVLDGTVPVREELNRLRGILDVSDA